MPYTTLEDSVVLWFSWDKVEDIFEATEEEIVIDRLLLPIFKMESYGDLRKDAKRTYQSVRSIEIFCQALNDLRLELLLLKS